jgi:hypothetical protein
MLKILAISSHIFGELGMTNRQSIIRHFPFDLILA